MNLRNAAAATAAGSLLLACACASADTLSGEGDPSLASAAVVTFETSPWGGHTAYDFGPFTLSALPSVDVASPRFAIDGDCDGDYNTRGHLHVTNYGTDFQSLRFDFSAPTAAFGFLFGASDSSWTLNAYAANGTLLDTLDIAPVYESNAGDYFGFKGLAGASYATLTQNFDGLYADGGVDYVLLDNVSVAAVPEPESLALLLAGLAPVAWAVRRRRAR
jgi:hypothetical protein